MWSDLLNKFWQPIYNFGPKVPVIIIGLVVGVLVIKILLDLFRRSLKLTHISKALSEIVISLVAVVLWILLFSEIARELGLSSVAITVSGSLVVLGLALANGATSLISDIITGVFLAKDGDFEIGYRVKVGNIEGIVQRIDIRKVRIIDDRDNLHIIPNSTLDKTGWTIFERELKDDRIEKKRIYRREVKK